MHRKQITAAATRAWQIAHALRAAVGTMDFDERIINSAAAAADQLAIDIASIAGFSYDQFDHGECTRGPSSDEPRLKEIPEEEDVRIDQVDQGDGKPIVVTGRVFRMGCGWIGWEATFDQGILPTLRPDQIEGPGLDSLEFGEAQALRNQIGEVVEERMRDLGHASAYEG